MKKLLQKSSTLLVLLALSQPSTPARAANFFKPLLQKNTPQPGTTVEGTLTGKVVSASGEPLPGVTVIVKNTSTGTNTAADGTFQLLNLKPTDVLVFSYIGYTTREVGVGNQQSLQVTLIDDTKTLSEVVVVGYGTQRKSDLTGSVSSLKAENLNPGVNASIDQALQGRAAGVQISQSSSEPGGGVSVRVRGSSSINAGNDPLYVIDGLPIDNSSSLSSSDGNAGIGANRSPRNPLNNLNPNDIASIEVLKDASATAIYGSRGANGVILVTTKKGAKGKATVNYDVNLGTQKVAQKLDVLSPAEYIQAMNGIAAAEGRAPEFSEAQIAQVGAGTHWQDQIYQTAPLQNHNLSVSGGAENTSVFASLNYFEQDGVVKKTGIKKYIGRVNLEQKVGQKAQIGANLNTSFLKDNNSIDGVNNNEGAGPINAALLYDPTEPVYDADGKFSQSANLTVNNPMSLVEGISSISKTNRTLGNLYLRYTLLEGLETKLNIGSDRQTSRRDLYNSTKTINGGSAKGIANVSTLERSNVLLEYTLNYTRQLPQNSHFNVLGGVTYQSFNSRLLSGTIRGFASDALGTDNLGLGDTNNDNLGSNQQENTLLSYLGRVNYTFHDKYLVTASFRADGSSRFGANNKYGYFPSLALGWRLAEEAFIPDLFSDLKLRASWGLTGNQDIANYASLATYTTGANVVLDGAVYTGTRPSRIANDDLKWETTEQLNVGLDASIWQGRVSGSIDLFVKNTHDLLLDMPIPQATGFSSILSNVGKIQNRGVELMLSSTNIDKGAFRWNSTLNLSAIRNEVKDLGNVTEIVTGNVQSIGNTSLIRVGAPAYSYYGYQVLGIFKSAEEVAGSAQPTAKPGYPIFADINGDQKITPADQVILGNPFPDFTYGFHNSVSYKRFQLDVFFQGQQGGEMLNLNLIESLYPNNIRRNRLAGPTLDRWTPENPDTKWFSGANTAAYGGGKVNSLVLQDASFLRLKNVQVSYNLPVQKLKGIQSAKVYLTGQNLYTFTDYVGFDPEANAFGNSNVRLDYNAYPLARTWVVGLNIGF